MMIQEILTGITVAGAFIYTLYSVWKTFSEDRGGACGGGCPSCSAKDTLLRDINGNQKNGNFGSFRPLR